jgi:formylglycine-generating enzyme required for sulfatase activity
MKPFLITAFMLTSLSFKSQLPVTFKAIELKKTYAKIKSDLLMSKYEVSNQDYRDFLTDLQETKQLSLYNQCLPDTLVWRNETAYNEPYVQYYFRHPAYNNYPVVGVSYEAANEYCNWLTTQYNQNPKRKYKSIRFKLPTSEEWVLAAQAGDTSKVYTWGTGFIQNNRKEYLCNFRHTNFLYDSLTKKYTEVAAVETGSTTGLSITANVASFYPNSFGIFNICGNVAEMVEEKGIARGGSFNDPAYKVRILSEKKYSVQQADIGFRVAIKIIEE